MDDTFNEMFRVFTFEEEPLFQAYCGSSKCEAGCTTIEPLLRSHEQCFQPATVGRGTQNIIEPTVRSAMQLHATCQPLPKEVLNQCAFLLPEIYHGSIPVTNMLLKINKYTTGGYFNAHYDTKISDRHIGTLLLIPPNQEYAGGEFVMYDDKSEILRVSSCHPSKWLGIAFRHNVKHECTPVISGTRVTIQTSLLIDEVLYEFMHKASISRTIRDGILEDLTEEHQDILTQLPGLDAEDQVKRHSNKLQIYAMVGKQLSDDDLTDLDDDLDITDILHDIEDSKHTYVALPLCRPYYSNSPADLLGKDVALYNALCSAYHKVYFILHQLNAFYKNDGTSSRDDFEPCECVWDGIDYDHRETESQLKFISPSWDYRNIGLLRELETEFNDQGAYSVNAKRMVGVMIVDKSSKRVE